MELSIIMLAYNQPSMELATTIQLLETTKDVSRELIIIVQDHENYSRENINAWATMEDVKVIGMDENVGIPRGWNAGVKEARGEYVCIANSDITLPRSWYERLRMTLNTKGMNVGVTGPTTSNAKNEQGQVRLEGDQTMITPEAVNELNELLWRTLTRRRPVQVKYVNGFFYLTTRAIIEEVGPFDEEYGLGYFEEYDWNKRLQEKGYVSAWSPWVFIHHMGSMTFKRMDEQGFDSAQLREDSGRKFLKKWNEMKG